MNGMMKMGVAVVLSAALSGAAAGLQAQKAPASDDPRAGWADQLSSRGMEIAQADRAFEEAVTYLRQAALLRGPAVQSVNDLRNAGRLAWYAGQGAEAVSILEDAGETALEIGLPEVAAEAFLDGAWVAVRQNDPSTARQLVRRSQEVMRTASGMPASERRRLRDRIAEVQL